MVEAAAVATVATVGAVTRAETEAAAARVRSEADSAVVGLEVGRVEVKARGAWAAAGLVATSVAATAAA